MSTDTVEAVGDIFRVIPMMIAECEPIAKDCQNKEQGFKYRSIDAVYKTVQPLLAKYKVFPVSTIIEDHRDKRTTSKGSELLYTRIKMRYTFYADDGSHVSTEVIGEGMDSGDKASNKAMSVAYKYALFQLLCIPIATVDPDEHDNPEHDANAPQAQPRGQRVDPQAVAAQSERWKRIFGARGNLLTPEEWIGWARRVTESQFDPTKASQWTPELLAKVRGVLDAEEKRGQ